ncbi:unnamed protein product [Spodoptera littoralis]|uniref:J domain-containing protein n=1 Tax=Spodoptera littoralis TaxID=7109 RepID=A0A9P0IGY4_SPOLI|nr:unnamed protein product [Spodoptera littoralis]CAH1645994.1 unnamed protein product [Spodoptera littoralis]
MEEPFTDYYKVLECDRNASTDELKQNYKRLILSSHPDKMVNRKENFLLVQKAWSVLKDPYKRKQYDAALFCLENDETLLYDSISIKDMSLTGDAYTYPCRCGGNYVLRNFKVSFNVIVVCEGCSLSIYVEKPS